MLRNWTQLTPHASLTWHAIGNPSSQPGFHTRLFRIVWNGTYIIYYINKTFTYIYSNTVIDYNAPRGQTSWILLGFKAPFPYGSPSGSWTCHWCRVSSLGLVVVCRVMLSPFWGMARHVPWKWWCVSERKSMEITPRWSYFQDFRIFKLLKCGQISGNWPEFTAVFRPMSIDFQWWTAVTAR